MKRPSVACAWACCLASLPARTTSAPMPLESSPSSKKLPIPMRSPAQIIEIYRSNELMDQIENMALEEQVIDAITERAKVVKKPMSFKEVMEQS
jgi:hypothetical protein